MPSSLVQDHRHSHEGLWPSPARLVRSGYERSLRLYPWGKGGSGLGVLAGRRDDKPVKFAIPRNPYALAAAAKRREASGEKQQTRPFEDWAYAPCDGGESPTEPRECWWFADARIGRGR